MTVLWFCIRTLQGPQDWKKSAFVLIPKKGNAKECSNYGTVVLISHASKVMLKILQARLQKYMNWEPPDVLAGFWKGKRNQRSNWQNSVHHREFQKNIYFCFIVYVKAFECVGHNKLWKILKKMGISNHLTCLLRILYVSQEATVTTRQGTMEWLKIGKGEWQGCICRVHNTYMQST